MRPNVVRLWHRSSSQPPSVQQHFYHCVCVCVCVWASECVCVCVCVSQWVCVCVCVCVGVCVTERESATACVRERDRQREWECVWVCVWCVYVWVCVCVCVCVCVRERERERESVHQRLFWFSLLQLFLIFLDGWFNIWTHKHTNLHAHAQPLCMRTNTSAKKKNSAYRWCARTHDCVRDDRVRVHPRRALA